MLLPWRSSAFALFRNFKGRFVHQPRQCGELGRNSLLRRSAMMTDAPVRRFYRQTVRLWFCLVYVDRAAFQMAELTNGTHAIVEIS